MFVLEPVAGDADTGMGQRHAAPRRARRLDPHHREVAGAAAEIGDQHRRRLLDARGIAERGAQRLIDIVDLGAEADRLQAHAAPDDVLQPDEGSAANGNELSRKVEARAEAEGAGCVVISAKIESEIATLPAAERADFLEAVGLKETGLARVVRAGYQLLDLVTFFTVGPKEARAWTVRREARAPEAAGVIHTDFEKGFIRAETIAYDDYVALAVRMARDAEFRAAIKSRVARDKNRLYRDHASIAALEDFIERAVRGR